jgi:ribosomal protein S18 acetylase RimI-like enzyme
VTSDDSMSEHAIQLKQGRELTDNDIRHIVRLHSACLKQGFLSTLGEDLLALLYRDMTMQEDVFLIVAEVNGEIVGFVAGACRVGGVYWHFALRHAFGAGMRILPSLFSLKALRRVTEKLFYPFTRRRYSDIPLPEVELLSMAVSESHRGTPVASALYRALMEQFQAHGEKAEFSGISRGKPYLRIS